MPSKKAALSFKVLFEFSNDQLRLEFVAAIHDRGGGITDPALQPNGFAELFEAQRANRSATEKQEIVLET